MRYVVVITSDQGIEWVMSAMSRAGVEVDEVRMLPCGDEEGTDGAVDQD